MARITTTTEWLRHDFTEAERLQMGADLADAHNRLASIEEEESVVKAKFKERKVTIEQKVGTLSRELGIGYTMQNIQCRLEYDKPNPYEVSIIREDTGELVRVRPMTADERQTEIKFDEPVAVNPEQAEEVAVESAENIADFFTKPSDDVPEDESEEDTHADEIADAENNHGQDESEPENFDAERKEACSPEHDAEFETAKKVAPAARRGRRPKGFAGPTNPSAAEL